jgi:hypothetical protein
MSRPGVTEAEFHAKAERMAQPDGRAGTTFREVQMGKTRPNRVASLRSGLQTQGRPCNAELPRLLAVCRYCSALGSEKWPGRRNMTRV